MTNDNNMSGVEKLQQAAKDQGFDLWLVPFDPRFPNTNQTRNCWQNYVDYFRCTNLRGMDYKPCEFFKKNFTYLCPNDWVSKWDEQRENGTFPTKL